MKNSTQQIQELKLNIQVAKFKIKELELEIKEDKTCDKQDKLNVIDFLNERIEDYEIDIEVLGLVW